MSSRNIILCIDDEMTILNSLKAELKAIFKSEFYIEVAQNGADALELIDELLADNYSIALVISDYLMPNMKGDELLKQIHIKSPETINILLTGYATIDGVANAIAHAKLYRYISKPWQQEDFKLTVTQAIHRYLKDQELRNKNIALEKLTQEQGRLIQKLRANEQHIMQINRELENALQNEIRLRNLAYQQEETNRRLADLSNTDSLTGIANRRQFDDFLQNEWDRAKLLRHPITLGMIDIDWFKKYNDYYGHQAGDETLRLIAQTLKEQIRNNYDLVARYGGEEFVFLCPGSSPEQALIKAQTLCSSVESLAILHECSLFQKITASIGVASLIPDDTMSFKLLIKLADDALYAAKGSGRNQAHLSTKQSWNSNGTQTTRM